MTYASYFFGAILFIYRNRTPALFHGTLEEQAMAGTQFAASQFIRLALAFSRALKDWHTVSKTSLPPYLLQ